MVLNLRRTRFAFSNRLSGFGGGGGQYVGGEGEGAGEPPPPMMISSVSLFSGSPNASLSDFTIASSWATTTTPSEKEHSSKKAKKMDLVFLAMVLNEK